jgi:hypothetical protein
MREARPNPTEAELIAAINTESTPPVAIQALWDGDTVGWFLCLQAVYPTSSGWRAREVALLTCGTDYRLFSGEVPPWPEARIASELGEAVARHYGVPFFFPSPNEPDDDCPPWWQQDRAVACARCHKLVFPTTAPHRLPGLCYSYDLRQSRS